MAASYPKLFLGVADLLIAPGLSPFFGRILGLPFLAMVARLYAHTADDLFRRIVDLAARGLGCRYSRTQLPNQLIVAPGENDGLLTFRRLEHRLQIAHQHLIQAVECSRPSRCLAAC
jgi:hypothetical protein